MTVVGGIELERICEACAGKGIIGDGKSGSACAECKACQGVGCVLTDDGQALPQFLRLANRILNKLDK